MSVKLDFNIESPFIKVVQECITKTFKSHKKLIEKEINFVVGELTKLKKQGPEKGAQTVVENLDKMVDRLRRLDNNYQALVRIEDHLFDVMAKRLEHLVTVNDNQDNPEIMKDYFTKRLNRIILDYLLRENYMQSAEMYLEESHLKDFSDLEVFQEIHKIVGRLKSRDCSEALKWCNENKTKLQKSKSQLEFKLRFQELVQYLKSNDIPRFLKYSREHISKFNGEDQSYSSKIQQAMGMLIYSESQRQQQDLFKKLIDDNRWSELQDLFMKEAFSLYSQPNVPQVMVALQSGISVLKTEFCKDDSTFNEQCPTCSKNLKALGQKLPFAHQTQTTIACRVTGEIMNDQNPPIYLPSGYVVSEKALEQLQDSNEPGKIRCPETNARYSQGELKKVYFI